MTMISKKFLLFEVSISNRLVFLRWSRIRDRKMRQAHILATRGPRSWATDTKNFQMAITRSIFAQKIFHDGHRTSKHGKFKSKKQIFLDFFFLLHEALLDPNKGLCKRKNDLNKIWASYGRLKVFGCRWLNFAALWWPKYAFVAIFDSGFSISAKNRLIWYTNLKK